MSDAISGSAGDLTRDVYGSLGKKAWSLGVSIDAGNGTVVYDIWARSDSSQSVGVEVERRDAMIWQNKLIHGGIVDRLLVRRLLLAALSGEVDAVLREPP